VNAVQGDSLTGALEEVKIASDDLDVDPTGHLLVGRQRAWDLISRFGSPLYVISERTIRTNYRRFYGAFAANWAAPINVLYAIKANNNLAIRALLSQEGAGGDCFGQGELYATFVGGADPAKIVMNGSSKTDDDLREAVRLGVRVNIDAEDEIERLRLIATSLRRRARVNIRLKVIPEAIDGFQADYTTKKPESLAKAIASKQWGFSLEKVESVISAIQRSPALVLDGYHFHLGRVTSELGFYASWASALGQSIVELHERTGFSPSIVDVGGGYARERDPESQRLDPNPSTLEDYAAAITSSLGEPLTRGGIPLPELWLEPGRSIVGNAGVLIGTVGSVKHDLGMTWVNVDISINNLMRIESHHSAYHLLAANRLHDPHDQTVTVVGALCTGAPLGANRSMPSLERGDLMAVLDAGMYAETASTQFNGVPRPATVLVSEEGVELIKERETVLDVFAKHRIPPRLAAGVTSYPSNRTDPST
jgi:diaminopimelate decarboxylase